MQSANSVAFQLWIFLIVSLFKETFKNQPSKSSKRIYSFLPKFNSPRSQIDPSHFRNMNWVVASNRVEYCIENAFFTCCSGIVPEYMFKP